MFRAPPPNRLTHSRSTQVSYVDKNLNVGEKVIARTSIHPIIFAPPALFAVLAIGLALSKVEFEVTAIVFLLAVVSGISPFVKFVTSELAITTTRVIIKVGWLSRRTIELQLAKVEGIVVAQDIIGRIFDYGTLVVGGTGGTKESFSLIRAPIVFRKQVQQQIDASHPAAEPENVIVREERECPHCAERILAKAARCRFCGQDVA